jgi:hypothetical protein
MTILRVLVPWCIGVAGTIGFVSAQDPLYDWPAVADLPVIDGLPDPFIMEDGSRVATLEDWEEQRAYIKDMMLYYEYGYFPPDPENLQTEVGGTSTILNGNAEETGITFTCGPDNAVSFRMDLSVPTGGNAPFPVVVTGDREWYRTRGLEQATDRGYMVADFYRTDLDPDMDDRSDGVHPIYPDWDWATVSAWAWGYYRVVDYLATRDDVDMEKIVFTGHSRGGKTALLAGAMDDRAAIVVPNGSGAGGCGCYRYMRGSAESLDAITAPDRFDYWFQPRLRDFVGNLDRLPFDQHFLKALVAPRALLCTDALGDTWANPWGSQQTQEGVREVYGFFGVPDKVGIHYRQGDHSHNTEDWEALLDFADLTFYGDALPADYYDENFDKDESLFNWESPEPLVWGCMDSNYTGYDENATAHIQDSCGTVEVFFSPGRKTGIAVAITYSHLAISVAVPGAHSIEIIDMKGEVAFYSSSRGVKTYQVKGLDPGIYFANVQTGASRILKRIVIF